jgi:hypothetical protein
MCKELFLAFLYFSTIFIVNFFLGFLVKNYLRKVFYLRKLKNIEKKISLSKNNLIPFLYFYNKYKEKSEKLKKKIPGGVELKDSLVIGNIYIELKKEENFSSLFYYKLQETMYLSL